MHFPVLRWGQPYKSLEVETITHHATGEPIAELSKANAALVQRDLKFMSRARQVLCQIPQAELVARCQKAAELYLTATLPVAEGITQSPEDYVNLLSATTGLPLSLAKLNMQKLHHVMANTPEILHALTRGLNLSALAQGHYQDGSLTRSFQATSPVLSLVLPNNSPGVHGLWLPVIPMQIGLILKPGSQEPWTPYRIAAAMFEAGIPRQAIAIYPGGHDIGQTLLTSSPRVMIFGGQQTVDQHKGNPRVQVHGPGFSKILLGSDTVDSWRSHLPLMLTSVAANSGRSCINASGIWAPSHTEDIADALAQELVKLQPLPPEHPDAKLAAFVNTAVAEGVDQMITKLTQDAGVTDVTAKYRTGPRLIKHERHAFLLPTVLHCDSPDVAAAQTEFMFPFVSVVRCPQEQMLAKMKETLVCTALTSDAAFRQQLIDAPNIDRLNLGPVPTVHLNWLQPHEGNLTALLYRERALQLA